MTCKKCNDVGTVVLPFVGHHEIEKIPCPECALPGVQAQQMPINADDMPPILDLVKVDLDARTAQGIKTYGVPLKPHNGRNCLIDAYHEALDLVQYLRQKIYEEEGK
jgi:hypothetical protein